MLKKTTPAVMSWSTHSEIHRLRAAESETQQEMITMLKDYPWRRPRSPPCSTGNYLLGQ